MPIMGVDSVASPNGTQMRHCHVVLAGKAEAPKGHSTGTTYGAWARAWHMTHALHMQFACLHMKGMHAAHTQRMDGAMKKDSALTRTASVMNANGTAANARHTCNTRAQYIHGLLAWDAHGICTTRTWHGIHPVAAAKLLKRCTT